MGSVHEIDLLVVPSSVVASMLCGHPCISGGVVSTTENASHVRGDQLNVNNHEQILTHSFKNAQLFHIAFHIWINMSETFAIKKTQYLEVEGSH